ncbi:phosphoglucosamine mutase family protein, partial [Tanacetum coccineum]
YVFFWVTILGVVPDCGPEDVPTTPLLNALSSIASAATLVAAQCVEVAESMRIQREHLIAVVNVSLIIQLMYVTMLEGTQARLRGWQQTAVGRESKFFFWNFFDAESHLAFETSGHGATKENHLLNDGAYLMVCE